ncbi:MAG: SpoIIE family protein phosphatase [Acidobacteriaceae bacterium]|nr:SpoIIE family protein phosphatase [Acidobacteriaceae bacterium]
MRELAKRLGTSGIVFLIAVALYFVAYFTGNGLLLFFDFCALVVLGVIVCFRLVRHLLRNALWSLRSRLLLVYALFGVLPVLLLFLLFVVSGWALVSELAVYLATSALERRLESVSSAITTIRNLPVQFRQYAIPEIEAAYKDWFPEFSVEVKDKTGDHEYPESSPRVTVSPKWRDVSGLLVMNKRFYAWAHYIDQREEITVLAPLSNRIIANLVPHLGVIALVETPNFKTGETISAGALNLEPKGNADNPDFVIERNSDSGSIPPPMSRFDIPVALPSTIAHYHLEYPGKEHQSVLWVHSRPSAVMRAFFSQSDLFRGILSDILIAIAVLFLLVEIGAVIVGVSLSRRITRAVNQLYEGTRRVIRGDFSHRIPVSTSDQLGELASSFNQMTGNLERLLSIEKERERLHAEIEIAREVQQQLYPQEEPPRCGLQLIARCDPARMVSGDYYDYAAVGKAKLAFAIGDVAGKGISAALLMATIQAALRAQVSHSQPLIENECSMAPEIDSATLVTKLNQQVYAHTSPEKYATFFFAVYDEPTRALSYTNAGHLSPLLFRNGNVTSLDSNGTIVGAFPNAKYDASCITIEPGDLLVCYTDGITEPENAYGEMFGEERLVELVQRHLEADEHEIIRVIFDAVRGWTGTPELHDDMTLLLARQVGAAA